MPRPCVLARRLSARRQCTRVPPAASPRVISALPDTIAACLRSSVVGYFRRLGLTHATADAVDRRRFSKPSCPARLILFRWAAENETHDARR
jgi:hypothetical protein